jgi:hypothetical protein|tara:strand:+ start:877 stop:1089 length:213 start_codon:yes stop_codon:yes gene_type:complete
MKLLENKTTKLALIGVLLIVVLTHISIFASKANAIGVIYIDPYLKINGTMVQGHFRTEPDGFCFNNFTGC